MDILHICLEYTNQCFLIAPSCLFLFFVFALFLFCSFCFPFFYSLKCWICEVMPKEHNLVLGRKDNTAQSHTWDFLFVYTSWVLAVSVLCTYCLLISTTSIPMCLPLGWLSAPERTEVKLHCMIRCQLHVRQLSFFLNYRIFSIFLFENTHSISIHLISI